jgi:hypothetical protein
MAVRSRKTKGVNTMPYPGGKGNCYQHIINQMPPHDTYIETHLGGGSVMAKKRPARLNIGIEIDPDVLHETAELIVPGCTAAPGCAGQYSRLWTCGPSQPEIAVSADTATNGYAAAQPGMAMLTAVSTAKSGVASVKYSFVNGDAMAFISSYKFTGREVVYLDPPYIIEERKSQRPIYKFEYTTDDHVRLLQSIIGVDCFVIISGYWSELYADMLHDWRTATFTAVTRGNGVATEWLWCNFPEPTALHDYRYLGDSYNERWNLKKRKRRWVKRLKAMPALERKMMLWAMSEAGFDFSGPHSH